MRTLSFALALLLAIQISSGGAALAQLSFSGGSVSGQAPVNKVGALLLADSLAIITANTMEIQGKTQNSPKEAQLHGKIFKVHKTTHRASGYVCFDSGPSLAALDASNCDEYVKMIDGTKVVGAITEVNDKALTCARRSIPINEISEVHSARVFIFSSSLDGKTKMDFRSTCAGFAVTSVKSRGQTSKRAKLALAAGAVGTVTIAVVLPIVIPQAVTHHHNHQLNTRSQNNYVYNRLNSYLHSSPASISSSSSSSTAPVKRPPPPPPGGGGGGGNQ